ARLEGKPAGPKPTPRTPTGLRPVRPAQGIAPPGNAFRLFDPRLKAVVIDRSPGDAYMAVKVDSEGRLFVGGRRAVYVFEPLPGGGYGPRHELMPFPEDSIII